MTRYQLIFTVLAPLLIFALFSVSAEATTQQSDILIYADNNYDAPNTLMMYDPNTDEHTQLYQSDNLIYFTLSITGDVTISGDPYGNFEQDIFLLDIHNPDAPLINLTETYGIAGHPQSWSYDGRYLAFTNQNEDNEGRIFLWDGNTVTNITPLTNIGTPIRYTDIIWNSDNQVAFTAIFGYAQDDPKSEIFIWDDYMTYNLSQNPDGEDRAPTWNSHNDLAFLSARDGYYGIYIWDGSTVADALDANSFEQIAPEATRYYSFPHWVDETHIAFGGFTSQDTYAQVYLWDGRTAINMSQNPNAHNGGARWADNGNWAFITYFSSEQNLYIRDADNNTLLVRAGQYTPAWSADNQLIFCDLEEQGLSLWNGEEVITIESGWEIWAQWQSGQSVVCTNG